MKRYLSNFELTEEFVRKSVFDCLGGSPTRKSRWKEKKTIFFLCDVKGFLFKTIHSALLFHPFY